MLVAHTDGSMSTVPGWLVESILETKRLKALWPFPRRFDTIYDLLMAGF